MKTAQVNIKEKIDAWGRQFANTPDSGAGEMSLREKPGVESSREQLHRGVAAPATGFLDIQILKSIGGVPKTAETETANIIFSRIKRNAQYMVDLIRLDMASQDDLLHIAKNIALDAEQITVVGARFENNEVRLSGD